jgi:hypothetical protein
MNTDPRTIAFETCLQKLQAGESLDRVLKQYPQWADELRPLLLAARAADSLGKSINIPIHAQERNRARFMAQAQQYNRTSMGWFTFNFSPLKLAALIIILVLIFGGLSSAVVSAQALPGDSLYPVKLITEQTRLFLTKDPTNRLKLEQSYDQERRQEVQALIQRSRSTPVKFTGGLRAMNPGEWLVDNVRVEITPETQVVGNIEVGYYVEVQGVLQSDGKVAASLVRDREYTVYGTVQEMTVDRWIVAGITFRVTPQTVIHGTPTIGSPVEVDAALNLEGDLQAHTVTVTGSPSVPTTSASATPTVDEGDQPSPTATPAVQETEVSGGDKEPTTTQEIEPTHVPKSTDDDHGTPRPSRTPYPTSPPGQSKTPEPGGDDDHTGTPRPSRTPYPTETPRPTSTHPTRTPEATESSHESETPQPSRTPRPTQTLTVTPTLKATDD